MVRNLPLNQRTARERFDVHRPRVRAVANLLRKNVPIAATIDEMAALAELPSNAIDVTARLMIFIGALDRHKHRGRSQWTLLKDGDELDRAVDLEMERQMRGGLSPESIRDKKKARAGVTRRSAERVAVVEDRHQNAVGAVVGPERPPVAAIARAADVEARQVVSRGQEEAHQIVLAAKQYRTTGGLTDDVRKARDAIDALAALGVEVPDALRQKAVTVRDDRLSAIADVLPYVEALERQVVALGDQLRSMADYGELRQYRDRHRREHEQRVAEQVADAMRQEARK